MKRAYLFRIFVLFGIALLLMILSMVLWPHKAVSFAKSFADVPEDSTHYAAIEYLKSASIVQGYSDGTFQPDKLVNRAEALKMIFGQAKIDSYKGMDSSTFTDIATNAWFYPYVMKAFQEKFINGYDDGTFKPANPVNLAELLKMALLSNVIDVQSDNSTGKIFADVTTSLWYAPYAHYARDKNLILSHDDGTLQAGNSMTRGEVAEVLYRLDTVKKIGFLPFGLSTNWKYFENAQNNFRMKAAPDWEIVKNGNLTVIWKRDPVNHQNDYEYVTPLSAKIVIRNIALKEGLTQKDYFAEMKTFIQSVFPNETIEFTEKQIHNLPALQVSIPKNLIQDWYFYLPNQHALSVYTQVGNGSRTGDLKKLILATVGTMEYVEGPTTTPSIDKESLLKLINENILVEGKGKQVIGQIGDAVIFETDEIGVGTGPVDYYYSVQIDLSLKHERGTDVILSKRTGKTSKF